MRNDARKLNHHRLGEYLIDFFYATGLCDQIIESHQIRYLKKLWKDRNYQKLHHEICKLMFDEAEQGEKIWIRIDEQDDTITSDNLESYSNKEESPYYRVSIMTNTMLFYDFTMFTLIREENSDDNSGENGYATNMYKPFFFNFLIDITENKDKMKFLTNPDNINRWYIGSFSENEEGTEFSGYVERIASPAEYREGKIKISSNRLPQSVLNEINEVYDLGPSPYSNDTAIQNELDRILEKPEINTARIYNVGNGNCIYLKGRNSFGDLKILYDIGYYCTRPGKNIKNKTYRPSISAIRSIKPQCVIISHWDSDHYYGCAYADPEVFRCKWIAPNLGDNKNVSARRVAKYLQVINKIILVDRSSGRQIARIIGIHSEFRLYIGEKRPGKDVKITAQNKEGIVLEYIYKMPNKVIHTFMAGDVPYESIPPIANFSSNTPYDYLVVPHHGAEMETSRLTSTAKKDGYAIICTKKGKKGRLTRLHKKALTNNKYSVRVTGATRLCIELDLLNHKAPKHCN